MESSGCEFRIIRKCILIMAWSAQNLGDCPTPGTRSSPTNYPSRTFSVRLARRPEIIESHPPGRCHKIAVFERFNAQPMTNFDMQRCLHHKSVTVGTELHSARNGQDVSDSGDGPPSHKTRSVLISPPRNLVGRMADAASLRADSDHNQVLNLSYSGLSNILSIL
jgi:hypothetical protein